MILRRLTTPLSIHGCSLLVFSFLAFSCQPQHEIGSFGYDLEILKNATNPIVLKSGDAMVAVVGEYQGRVMTSSSKRLKGKSYGWFRRETISEGLADKNFSSLGGEDRMWFGPEAGKFSVYFEPGKPQIPENVVRPPALDTLPFNLIEANETSASFGNTLKIRNYQDYLFTIDILRTLSIYSRESIETNLGIKMDEDLSCVGFEARTTMKNSGPEDWKKENGLLSIWDLGCFPPSPQSTVVIPTRNGLDSANIYFTPINDQRIRIIDEVLFYRGDADYLNKIGIPPENTLPVFGSFFPETGILTIIQFAFQDDPLYVNSHWVKKENPYGGDVINVFNDGKTETTDYFGPFYELETSSSARELKVGENHSHKQATYHFEGSRDQINRISLKLLNVSLEEIESALP